jgi:hypothetical protein
MKQLSFFFILILGLLSACQKDPSAGIKSHERAIETFSLGKGLVQVGPAVVDRDSSKVTVKVLIQPGTDLSKVSPTIITSYKSTIVPASGATVNFAGNNDQAIYTVTAETGETRKWTVILVPFSEALIGTYTIQDLTLYGGTGPQYGGGGVFTLESKNVWPADGPVAELDNTLTFTYTGVTADGNTYGTVVNSAGPDGKYANFIYSQNPVTDVNHFYRTIPEGTGKWVHNYTTNLVTFTNADSTVTTSCTYDGAGTVNLGNGLTKTTTDNAFTFTLNGADNYNTIYSDYDKIVERPYTYWIDVKKQ